MVTMVGIVKAQMQAKSTSDGLGKILGGLSYTKDLMSVAFY